MEKEHVLYLVLGGLTALYYTVLTGIHVFNKYQRDGSIIGLTNLPNPRDIKNPADDSKLAIILEGSYYNSYRNIQDVDLVTALFRRLGYHTDYLSHQAIDRNSIRERLNRRFIDSNEDSQTIVYFTGHGNIPVDGLEGILVADETQVIGPIEFFGMVQPIRGRKLIMLDCCNSGIFTDYLKTDEGSVLLRDYVVISACPAGKITRSADRGYDGWISHFSYGFFQMLEQNKDRPIDMSTVDIKSGTTLARLLHRLLGWRKSQEDLSFYVQRVSDTSFIL